MILDDAWPAGDRLAWDDDETCTHWDFSTEPWTETPYTDDERAVVEARQAAEVDAEEARQAIEAAATERDRLRSEIATWVGAPGGPERTEALVNALAELVLAIPPAP